MKQQLVDNLAYYREHYYDHETSPGCCSRKVYLASFNSHEAFLLGSFARKMAIQHFKDKCAIIDITLADGQCLFHSVVNDMTTPFTQLSVQRKRKTAMGFGCSSLQVQHANFPFDHSSMASLANSIEDHRIAYARGETDAMAGAIPIFLTNLIGPPVACITIDGLEPFESHWLAFECLVALVEEQSAVQVRVDGMRKLE